MQQRGLIERSNCSEDRRGAFAELTDAGRAKLEDAARGHVEAVRTDLFDVLTTDQQRALREAGEALRNHLSADPGDGDGCSGRTP